jgi:hypothetical protein
MSGRSAKPTSEQRPPIRNRPRPNSHRNQVLAQQAAVGLLREHRSRSWPGPRSKQRQLSARLDQTVLRGLRSLLGWCSLVPAPASYHGSAAPDEDLWLFRAACFRSYLHAGSDLVDIR